MAKLLTIEGQRSAAIGGAGSTVAKSHNLDPSALALISDMKKGADARTLTAEIFRKKDTSGN